MAYEEFVFDRPIGRARKRHDQDGTRYGGSQRGLAFTLEWASAGLEGHLSFSIANELVWSTAGIPLHEKLWEKFLFGLAQAWPHILVEEIYPRGISPMVPSQAPAQLINRFYNIDEGQNEGEHFRAHHDISAWIVPERILPSLWLMREGNYMLLEIGGQTARWAYSDVVRTLRELGDHIALRASEFGVSGRCVKIWRARDNTSDDKLEQIAMGMSAERLAVLRKTLPVRNRAQILRGCDEIRAAARMLETHVPDNTLKEIIERIRAEPRREARILQSWSENAVAKMELAKQYSPRLQGRTLAQWLRKEINNEEGRVSPENLLADWGVAVAPFPTSPQIEAISFWGPSHGPAVLRNTTSKRSGHWDISEQLFGGQRFTLAHELAHFLVDMGGALPVAEVLGGRVPRGPEERANAFAAEFLLPENIAGLTYQRTLNVEEAVRDLTRKFGVTKTLAAFQILKRFGENSPVLKREDFLNLQNIAKSKRYRNL